jgi:hypothetical protein
MRQASRQYLQEESRLRGAQPRVQAVLYPFELECGLAPGSGTYVNTVYGGEPGKLDMAPGYFTSGSWLSPVLQGFSPYLDALAPAWEDPGSHLDLGVSLRSGATPAAVAAAPWARLSTGVQVPLGPYFQLQVELQESGRAWAVDTAGQADGFTAFAAVQVPDPGYESSAVEDGCLENLQLAGYLTLPGSEIIQTGAVRVDLARDFASLRGADLALDLDHRLGQWLNGPENAYLYDGEWTGKRLDLYHGWEAGGAVAWQLVYRGTLQGLTGLTHSWQQPHRVRLETQDYIVARLQQTIGAPTASGERRPFLRGAYRARAELAGTTAATVSEPVKTGSGSAVLQVLGDYRGDFVKNYLLEVQAGGEVGTATCRWSDNQGQSWRDTGLKTGGADAPLALEDGLAFYWEAGPGPDLAAGDRWTCTATPPVYEYQVAGGPFEAIAVVYLNGAASSDRVVVDAGRGKIQVTGRSAQVEAQVIKDGTTHPVDIVEDILEEVGLGDHLNQDSFALAKSLTAEYAVGVSFENLAAAQAIREIVKRCLYDFWIDFGEIKISAYLGED